MPLPDLMQENPVERAADRHPEGKAADQPCSLCTGQFRPSMITTSRSATGGSTCPSPIFDGVLVLERRFASVSHLL
ncbi:hypothetical protein CN933_27600 [Sinorhizobium sp. M4_45]|nr:hypothetical protein CN933_27600 [Sinorhizobium sp. M4_45]